MKNIILITVLALLALHCSAVFKPYQRTWRFKGNTFVRNVASDELSADWTISSRVIAQIYEDHVVFKLKDVKSSIVNKFAQDSKNHDEKEIPKESNAIFKPAIFYLKPNVSIAHAEDDPVWSVNIKRSIAAAFFMLNNDATNTTIKQNTLYGKCNAEYNVYQEEGDEIIVQKTIDHDSCEESLFYEFSTKSWDPTAEENKPIITESTYTYTFNNMVNMKSLKKIHTSSIVTVKPMPRTRSVQKIYQKKDLTLVDITEEFTKIDTSNINVFSTLTFDYTKGFKGGRDELNPNKTSEERITEFKENYKLFKKYFETSYLTNFDIKTNHTLDSMYNALYDMDSKTLEKLASNIFKKKDNLYQHMFLSVLPYLGTHESVYFIKSLVQNEDENLNDLLAIKILSTFPVYVENPNDAFLKETESFMSLHVSNKQVKYAGILSFAALLAEANRVPTNDEEIYKNYVKQYYKHFKEAEEYELKMTYLLGLINIGGSFPDEIIDILTDTNLSHHLRTLGIFGFRKNLNTKSEKVYTHFWPIVKNQTEHYEVRVAALDLLLYSDLSYENFQSIINWYQDEFQNPDERHLAHYLYTTVKSLENSTRYFEYLGSYATEALETMKHIKDDKIWSTGNYRMAFTDEDANLGGSIQTRLIANPDTNVVNVGIFSLNSFALSLNLGSYSAYVKTEGILDAVFIFSFLNRESEKPIEQLVNLIKENAYKIKKFDGIHIEVVISCDDRAVFGIHIDKHNIDHYAENPLFLDLLKLLIDYNTLSYPVMDYTFIASDLGTGIMVSQDIVEVSSYELENLDKIFNDDSSSSESNEVDAIEYNLKYRSLWIYTLFTESYNPLVEASAQTFKAVQDELLVNIPYSFNLTDFVFKWKHSKDSFNYIEDRVLGTSVDGDDFNKYCSDCEHEIILPVGKMEEETYDISFVDAITGINFNITESQPTEEQTALYNLGPEKLPGFLEIYKNHRTNSYADEPFMQPVMLLWHTIMYTTFLGKDISSLSIRSYPFYNEPTETVFDLEMDASDITNDNDPISGTEFDFSVAFTNRKTHNAEILNHLNASFIYKMTSTLPDSETQPHIEHNYDINIFYENIIKEKLKICLKREVLYPNRRIDKYSLEPIEPTKASTIIYFGKVESHSEHCPSSESITITEIYMPTEKQKQNMESMEEYAKCKTQSKGFKYVPPTDDCLAAHNVISRYDSCTLFADFSKSNAIPEEMNKAAKSEFGLKLFEYRRVNNTHVSFNISEEFLDHVFETNRPIYFEDTSLETTDPTDIMSVDPTTVAYDDYDLNIGISSICYITPNEIRSFRDKVIKNYKSDAVAFVECLNNTQSGLTVQRVSDNAIGFKFWSENNLLVASVQDGKPKIEFNGEEKKSVTDIKDEEFKIYFLDQDVLYITNGLVDIQYTTEYITIKTLTKYNDYICGLCSGDHK